MTTIPLRLQHTGTAFNSLFKQTYPPDAIYMNLPTEPLRGGSFDPLPCCQDPQRSCWLACTDMRLQQCVSHQLEARL